MSATGLALPNDDQVLVEQLKQQARAARAKVVREVNTELLRPHWSIGHELVQRRAQEGWGATVIDRLAADLQREFPGIRGFSSRNLKYMRSFASAWPDHEVIGQQAVARLPCGHVTVLLDRLDDQAAQDWYTAAAVHRGVGVGEGLADDVRMPPPRFSTGETSAQAPQRCRRSHVLRATQSSGPLGQSCRECGESVFRHYCRSADYTVGNPTSEERLWT